MWRMKSQGISCMQSNNLTEARATTLFGTCTYTLQNIAFAYKFHSQLLHSAFQIYFCTSPTTDT